MNDSQPTRQQKIDEALETWSWVARYKAQSTDKALLGPVEQLIRQLADLAGITLPIIDPATRSVIPETETAPAVESTPTNGFFDIWVEGFATNEGSDTARKVNPNHIQAASFEEAVAIYVASLEPKNRRYWQQDADGTWTMWGCQAFSDENSARNNFG